MDALSTLSEEVPHLQASFDPTVVFGGVTQYILWMVICWIITLVLILVVGRKLTLIPTNKFVNTVEYGYQFVRNDMGEGIIGHGFKKHVPFLATLFFFILISNFVGLIPGCKTPTGTISVTWALATISFIYFNVWGIKAKGGLGYLKSFAPAGLPKVMVPIIWFLELISTCIRWLTLAVRLYGNMFAGHMVLGIFALASSVFLTCGIQALDPISGVLSLPWFLLLIAMYALETLVAFLQAYVFTVLSAVYVQIATSAH
ncbi:MULTISPECIES: F0F1 ATP synthase subunit A [Adlercreutzia]|uniref:ATP synthase subunit a n=1 Tax=Adlercreutzia hattorii TaxID=2707299 RepID=A0A6F8SN71_9ACTN|nr:F0F1 ATP synthase subunit A [Adlercreutzia hattorii]BCA88986.1 ATP synthase subunit a [Adlercreutzia hattorii]